MIRTADRLSVAKAVASASVSWARRERWRTARPAANSGSTMIGIAASTKAESLGLVTTIIAIAPTNMKRLRNAIEAEEPKVALSWVVSADRREEIRAKVRDHPLPERHDQVVARSGGQREHGDNADHGEEIALDDPRVLVG